MSQENVEVIRRAVAALNDRDLDQYLACCTAEVQLVPPTAAIEGAYEGAEGVRRFFADVRDAAPDFHLDIEHMENISPNRILASLRASMSGRASGVDTGPFEVTNIYDLTAGKIKRVRVFRNREEALEAAGLSE